MQQSGMVFLLPCFHLSKIFPRKMVRVLHGKPLIYYAFDLINHWCHNAKTIVVTDDDEICMFAERRNHAIVYKLNESTYESEATVYLKILRELEAKHQFFCDPIMIVQPSAPLLHVEDFTDALSLLSHGVDTVVSGCQYIREWDMHGNVFANSFVTQDEDNQALRERDLFLLSRRRVLEANALVGKNIRMQAIPADRAINIQDRHDWWVCEKLLMRKRILFVIAGSRNIGMGHVYRAMMLAHELIDAEISFLCTTKSELAVQHITQHYFPSAVQHPDVSLEAAVIHETPYLVINDFLDTSMGYVKALKASGIKVVNFEDGGPGAAFADLVINALLDDNKNQPNICCGPDYFCLRTEFLDVTKRDFRTQVENVLITFGGVDTQDRTNRILQIVGKLAENLGINLFILPGPGYSHTETLSATLHAMKLTNLTVDQGTKRISDYMAKSDFAISAGGRTLYELTHMTVPTIVLASNKREQDRSFACTDNGFLSLGIDSDVTDQQIVETFKRLVNDQSLRNSLHRNMQKIDLTQGLSRVISSIKSLLA